MIHVSELDDAHMDWSPRADKGFACTMYVSELGDAHMDWSPWADKGFACTITGFGKQASPLHMRHTLSRRSLKRREQGRHTM